MQLPLMLKLNSFLLSFLSPDQIFFNLLFVLKFPFPFFNQIDFVIILLWIWSDKWWIVNVPSYVIVHLFLLFFLFENFPWVILSSSSWRFTWLLIHLFVLVYLSWDISWWCSIWTWLKIWHDIVDYLYFIFN